MSEDTKIETYYQLRAQEFVDFLHDKELLQRDVSRESQRALEDYVAYLFQTYSEMAVRASSLCKRTKELMTNKHFNEGDI